MLFFCLGFIHDITGFSSCLIYTIVWLYTTPKGICQIWSKMHWHSCIWFFPLLSTSWISEPSVHLEPKTESHDNQNLTWNHFSTIFTCKQTLSLQLRQETTYTHAKKKLYIHLSLWGQSSKAIITFILDFTILVMSMRKFNFQKNQLPESAGKEWQRKISTAC